MNRKQVEALQAVGVRAETFDEACAWCGRPSTYHRQIDRYTHRDSSPHLDCWVALSQGRTPEPVVSQRDSRVRRAGGPRVSGSHRKRAVVAG